MLKQRIITAITAALLLFAVLFLLPEYAARAVIALLFMIAAWEWSGFLGTGQNGRYLFTALVAILILPSLVFEQPFAVTRTVFQIALVWWVLAFAWLFFYPTAIARPIRWFCGLLVIAPAYVAVDWLYQISAWTLLFALAIVWAADIGAYFAGKSFGRVKLAPQISPGKTWEGAIGGLFAVAILISVESYFLDFETATLLPLCLAVAVISVVGDLTVSVFKRTAGLKDSGSLFPGHGGFLDRADGVMAATPLFALGLGWLDGGFLL